MSAKKKTGPKSPVKIGQEIFTKSGWKGIVIEYFAHDNVVVQWQDGSFQRIRTKELQSGSVKPLNQPSVEGIGYFGVGRFVPNSYKHGEKSPPEIYGYWVRMFSRCYNPFELNKPKGISYRDVHISKEFHNYQNFAEWTLEQPNYEKGLSLDKDLLGNGKIYSQETCTFLPLEINTFLSEKGVGASGRGVNAIIPKAGTNATLGYIARVHYKGSREYLGFFGNPEEAFIAYKQRKEEVAKLLAEEYKSKLTSAAYSALLSYTVQNDIEIS